MKTDYSKLTEEDFQKTINDYLAKIEFYDHYKLHLYNKLKDSSEEQINFLKTEEELTKYISYIWKKFVLLSISQELSDLYPSYLRICKTIKSSYINLSEFSIDFVLKSDNEKFIPRDAIYFPRTLKLVNIIADNNDNTKFTSYNISKIIKKYVPKDYLTILKDILYKYARTECELARFLQPECLNLSKRWEEIYFYKLKTLKQLKEYNQQWYDIVYNAFKEDIDRKINKAGYRIDKLNSKKELKKLKTRSEAVIKLNELLKL